MSLLRKIFAAGCAMGALLAGPAQSAIFIQLSPLVLPSGAWQTQVSVSGSIDSFDQADQVLRGVREYSGNWRTLSLGNRGRWGIFNGQSGGVAFDRYRFDNASFIDNLGAPASLELAGAPGGAFAFYFGNGGTVFAPPSPYLWLTAGYQAGTEVDQTYVAQTDIRSWARTGASFVATDDLGTELLRVQIGQRVPEPGSLALAGLALAAALALRRRRA